MKYCSAEELHAALEAASPETVLLDVRRPDEFADGHLPRAINVPIGSEPETYTPYLKKNIFLYCATDNRSTRVGAALEADGAERVTVLKWGYLAWRMGGYAIEK